MIVILRIGNRLEEARSSDGRRRDRCRLLMVGLMVRRRQIAIGWIAVRNIRRLILDRLVLRRLILRFVASRQTHQKQSSNN